MGVLLHNSAKEIRQCIYRLGLNERVRHVHIKRNTHRLFRDPVRVKDPGLRPPAYPRESMATKSDEALGASPRLGGGRWA